MTVQAKCVQKCWESTEARMYVPNEGPLPGGLYELDLSKPAHRKLTGLKTLSKDFIFQFDRQAANDPIGSVYFCSECGLCFESLNAIGIHTRSEHRSLAKKLAEAAPEPEVEEVSEPEVEDRRGKVPVTCKDCGASLPNIGFMSSHKKTCPAKPPEPVAPEVAEVGQATPA